MNSMLKSLLFGSTALVSGQAFAQPAPRATSRVSKLLLATTASIVALAAPSAMAAGGTAAKITPFAEFIASVRSAVHKEYAARAESKVTNPDTFAEMKAYILKTYETVSIPQVRHSFADENNSLFDCIPVNEQPSLRGSGQAVPIAPNLPQAGEKAAAEDNRESPLSPGRKDQYGNVMFCASGSIPMQRITLDKLTRFKTVHDFFQKDPEGMGIPPRGGTPLVAATHRYAHAYQFANNLGGHSFLNVWDPAIGANQIFSLSQHWYVGGSGTTLQTAEVGWQVYPQFYGNTKPVFFIYYTADNYNKTGCYNLTCAAFVQTNNSWAIGGAISPWSVQNGPQYAVEVAYYLYQGRWWLYVNGTASANAIGYYPATLYNGGALASHATEIDYGGEVVGTTSWPPMGSGAFASAGYGRAAYQRTIYYYPTGGGATYAKLMGSQAWPQDYTVTVTNYSAPWYESIFFGGPGGTQ